MKSRQVLARGLAAVIATAAVTIGATEATGHFKEATGFDYNDDATEIAMNGRTDVIKAMGGTKWGDIELKRVPPLNP
jgi:hypothetical protein